jgi:hypothetical protein
VSRLVGADDRIVGLLERKNDFLRGQIAVKDRQIDALNERVFATNKPGMACFRVIAGERPPVRTFNGLNPLRGAW